MKIYSLSRRGLQHELVCLYQDLTEALMYYQDSVDNLVSILIARDQGRADLDLPSRSSSFGFLLGMEEVRDEKRRL